MARVEERLHAQPHVLGMHVDAPREAAHVQVDESGVSAAELAELFFRDAGLHLLVEFAEHHRRRTRG